jgi:hypothetical protein
MTFVQPAAAEAQSRLWRRLTFATLALALLLRLCLVWSGGQRFWPDESRYQAANEAVSRFQNGQPKAGGLALVGTADHLFFKVVCLPAAWADSRYGLSPRRAAAYLSLFSVAALALLGSCARGAGAGPREAWLAVFFAACANTLFYYTRHLFPYDTALAFCLASLAFALRPASVRCSFLAGIFAALGFLTYDGYWMLGGVILIVHVLRAPRMAQAAVRAAVAAAGLALPLVIVVKAAGWLGGDLVGSFRQFSGTIFQGDFGKGYIFVWQYLWSAEGMMFIFWFAAAAYAASRILGNRALGRPAVWIGAALALYAGQWIFADVFKVFVAYGRTARVLVPFFCLVAAWSVDDIWARRGWTSRSLLGLTAAVGIVAGFNFAEPLRLMFPEDFLHRAAQIVWQDPGGVFRILNASRIRPEDKIPDAPPKGQLLLARRNPLQFDPYLFEGYKQDQRRYLEKRDMTMKVLRLPISLPERPDGYPGGLLIRLRFPTNLPDASEPLVTTGVYGKACIAWVHYIDSGHVSFNFDSWGIPVLTSGPVATDLSATHDVLVFFGSMLPPENPPQADEATRALLDRMRGGVLIMLDGQVVLAGRSDTYPSPPDRITVGLNLAGCSVAGLSFNGAFETVQAVSSREVSNHLRDDRAGDLRTSPGWDRFPGPLHMVVELPTYRSDRAEPLVTAGADGTADCLYLVYGEKGGVTLHYSQGGSTTLQSEPLKLGPDGRLDLIVSIGSMMPPESSPLYSANPTWMMLRDQVWVVANGKPVLARRIEPSPVNPADIRLLSNLVGVPLIQGYFTGQTETLQAIDPSAVVARIPPMGLDVSAPAMPLDGYPGPLHLKVHFPALGAGITEPLLVSGTAGAGDLIFVRYEGDTGIRFGVDHWSYGGPVSDPVALDPDIAQHDVVVSEGGLFPPPRSPLYVSHPEWRKLRDWVVVALDGRPVLVVPRSAYATRPDQITTGLNLIGGSTASAHFSGEIAGTDYSPPDQVLDWVNDAERATP